MNEKAAAVFIILVALSTIVLYTHISLQSTYGQKIINGQEIITPSNTGNKVIVEETDCDEYDEDDERDNCESILKNVSILDNEKEGLPE